MTTLNSKDDEFDDAISMNKDAKSKGAEQLDDKLEQIMVTVSYRGALFRRSFGSGASIRTLRKAIEDELSFPSRNQRLILKGKLLPAAESDSEMLIEDLKLDDSSKIMLVATTAETAEAVETAEGMALLWHL